MANEGSKISFTIVCLCEVGYVKGRQWKMKSERKRLGVSLRDRVG